MRPFLLLTIVVRLQKFVKIMMNKIINICRSQRFFFCRGNEGDATLWFGLQKYVITAAHGRRWWEKHHWGWYFCTWFSPLPSFSLLSWLSVTAVSSIPAGLTGAAVQPRGSWDTWASCAQTRDLVVFKWVRPMYCNNKQQRKRPCLQRCHRSVCGENNKMEEKT